LVSLLAFTKYLSIVIFKNKGRKPATMAKNIAQKATEKSLLLKGIAYSFLKAKYTDILLLLNTIRVQVQKNQHYFGFCFQ
jgi:hypothetical protein